MSWLRRVRWRKLEGAWERLHPDCAYGKHAGLRSANARLSPEAWSPRCSASLSSLSSRTFALALLVLHQLASTSCNQGVVCLLDSTPLTSSFVRPPTDQARRCATWSATHTVRTTHLSSAAPRDPINCMTAVCASPANDQGPLSRVRVDSDSATAVGACSSVCPPVFQWPSPLLATRPPRPPCRASSTNTVA